MGVTDAHVRANFGDLQTRKYEFPIVPLRQVPSAKEQMREQYLIKIYVIVITKATKSMNKGILIVV